MAKSDLATDIREVYEALGRKETKAITRKDFSSDGAYGMYLAAEEPDEKGKNDIQKIIYQTVLKAAELEKDKSDAEAAQRLKQLNFTYEQLKAAVLKVNQMIAAPTSTPTEVTYVPEEEQYDPLEGKSLDEV